MSSPAVPRPWRWVVLTLILLANMSGTLIQLSGAPVQLAVAGEFDVSAARIATWINLPLLSIALIAIPAGLAVDRLGGRIVVGTALLVMGAFGLARGLAPTFGLLMAATFVFGLGQAMLLSGMPRVVADWFPPAEVGRAVGIYTSGAALGVIAVFLAAPPLFAERWRPLFLGAGAIALAVFVGWILAVPRAGAAGTAAAPIDRSRLWADLRRLARRRDILFLVALCAATQVGMFSWLAFGFPFLVLVAGWSPALAGGVVSLTMVGFLAGATTMAAASDRVGLRRPFFAGAAGLGAAAFLSLALLPPGKWLWFAVIAIGFACATLQVLLFAVPIELPGVPREQVGACAGIIISGGFLAGMAASPALGAVIGDLQAAGPADFRTVWMIVAAVMLAAAAVARGLTESGWKRKGDVTRAVPAP